MKDTKHWITKLVPALAFAAGIIIVCVGGIITTSSAMKLAFFEYEPYSYYASEECTYDYSRKSENMESNIIETSSPYRLTPQEAAICKSEKEMEAKKRFQNTEKQDIVDGISSLLVGGLLVLAFRRKNTEA